MVNTLLTLVPVALGLWLAVGGGPAAPQTAAPASDNYAWADACKNCHEAVYDAWARTKHARALQRLSGSEQEQACVGCHVTGPKNKIELNGKVVNAGVQCESCHGAAAAHVKDPTVRTGLVKTPPEEVCTECHSDRSPKYKGFFYRAMLGFSHKP